MDLLLINLNEFCYFLTMKIIICVALEKELPDLFKLNHPHLWCRIQQLQAGHLIDLDRLPFFIIVTGVGPKSKNSLEWICRHLVPDEIINVGTAGGTALKTWHMCNEVSHVDSDRVLNPNLFSNLPIPYHEFQISSCSTVNEVSNVSGSNLVDMESFYIIDVCNSFNIPAPFK